MCGWQRGSWGDPCGAPGCASARRVHPRDAHVHRLPPLPSVQVLLDCMRAVAAEQEGGGKTLGQVAINWT